VTVYGITGGTGFLGGHLIDRLLAAGHTVRALVRSPAKAAPLAARGVVLIVGELTDRAACAAAFMGCDVVFHGAAALNGDYPTQFMANVAGTHAVMHGAADATVRRVVHVSTIAVYAAPLTGILTEAAPRRPGQYAYAVTKALAETEALTIAGQRGISLTIIRPGMIYGAGAGLWTKTLFQLACRPTVPFPLAGLGTAPPIHAADVVDLMLRLADHPAADREAFNCVSTPAPTWRDWLNAYAALCGHTPRWYSIPRPVMGALAGLTMAVSPLGSFGRELVDLLTFVQSDKTFSMDKARDQLGWGPRYDVTAGAALCADWLRAEGLL